jgi:hypothetical protein
MLFISQGFDIFCKVCVIVDISERQIFKFRCLRERLMKFSVLLPTVTSLHQSSHVHVISQSIFIPLVGNAALLK